jgi:hypothetical protein
VTQRRLARLEAGLLQQLMAGQTLGAALEHVATTPRSAAVLNRRVGHWLAAWVRAGAIARVEVP